MRKGIFFLILAIMSFLIFSPIVIGSLTTWTVKPLVSTSADEKGPVWSPDGSQLTYISNESGSWQVYIVNSDGTGKWQLSHGPGPSRYGYVWSPDSQYLLYNQGERPADLFKVQLNSTRNGVINRWNLTQIPTGTQLRWGESVQFSSDSSMIVVHTLHSGWPRLHTITDRNADAYAGDWTSIGKDYGMSFLPTWKPNENIIAYSFFSNASHSNLGDIWTIIPDDTSDLIVLGGSDTQQHVQSIAWSPNGQEFVFSEGYAPPNSSPIGPHLVIVNANGTNFRWLDGPVSHIAPQAYSWQADIWSSDGNYIVYSRGEWNRQDVYLIDRDGSNMRLVASSEGDDINARFSSDENIIFQTNRNGNWDIYIAIPNQAPVAICKDVTVEAEACCVADASVDDESYDPDGGPITIIQEPLGPYQLGETEVTLTVTDDSDASSICTATVTVVDTTPPLIVAAIVEPQVVEVGQLVNFDALVGDECDLTVEWNFGDGDTSPDFVTNHSYSAADIYTVTFTVTDSSENSTSEEFLVVVYDISGGFVTGGGWIWSPLGALVDDPDLEGKANFGFVSKYKKGATVPTGNTELQFKAGDLNFHSSSYEWLVVTGSNYAKFKGTGTINGAGEYKFMLWAGDSNPDTFTIKIWTEDDLGNETIEYWNGMDQPIEGGSIKIHKN